jgi:hypothetical protein
MFRTVLVPLDGSRVAESALPWAAGLARRSHGRLALAMLPELAAAAGLTPAGVASEPESPAGDAGYLSRTAAYWQPCAGSPIESRPFDRAVADLSEIAKELEADLVVTIREGSFVEGDDHPVPLVDVPTLLVRSAPGDSLPASADIRRILVVLDPDPGAESVLGPAGALASVTQAHLTLFQALGPSARSEPDRLTRAQRTLDRLADRLRAEGHRVAARAVAEEAESAILAALARPGFDVVVLRGGGHQSEPGLRRLAERIVRSTTQPILLVV